MGHPLELSTLENNYIEEWINQYYSQFSEKIIFKSHILSHKKGGSLESKWASSILIITDFHFLLFAEGKELTKKPPKDHHIYDCKKISSKVDYVVSFSFQKGKQKSKVILKADQMNYIVSLVRRLRLTTDSEHCKNDLIINLKFTNNKQTITKKEETVYEEFYSLYRGWCSYFNSEPNPIIFSFIQRLILKNNQEINLNEIPISDASDMVVDLIPFFNSLRHNEYFNSIIIKDLRKESTVKALSDLLLHNTTLKKIILKKSCNDSLQNIFLSLSLNKKNSIQILDISEQVLSTRSISSLINCLSTFNHALVYLNLSNCGIPSKSMTLLFESFEKNYGMSLTLEYLNISYNKLDDQANHTFISWIIKSRSYLRLKTLILNSCNITSLTLQHLKYLPILEHLDISHNKFDINDLERFFYILSIETLYRIDCNYCNLPKELVSVIFNKMSFKKLSVHLELSGLVIADDWDIMYLNMQIFKDTNISINTLRLENSKCTERSIIQLLNTISEIKVQSLILDGISIDSRALTSSGEKLTESTISMIKKSNNPDEGDSSSLSSSSSSSSTSTPTSSNNNNNNNATSYVSSTPSTPPSNISYSSNSSPNTSLKEKIFLSPLQSLASPIVTLGNNIINSSSSSSSSSTEHNGGMSEIELKQFQNSFLKSLSKIYFNSELKSLCIAGIGRLIKSFLPTIAKPSSVSYLDISGNSLSDQGAILLSKALYENKSLNSIHFDNNQITNIGYVALNHMISLESNSNPSGLSETANSISTIPTIPSTPSPSALYSMIYPSDDIDRLLNSITDQEERFHITQTISKLQMTLTTNSIHYLRLYSRIYFTVGFQYKKHDLYRHELPEVPLILYPVTPIPKDLIQKLNDKLSISLEATNQSTLSSIHLFLKDPSTRITNNPKFRTRLNSIIQYTNNHSLPSRHSPIPFILSIPDTETFLNLSNCLEESQSIPSTPKSLVNSINTQSSTTDDHDQVLEDIQAAMDYCINFVDDLKSFTQLTSTSTTTTSTITSPITTSPKLSAQKHLMRSPNSPLSSSSPSPISNSSQLSRKPSSISNSNSNSFSNSSPSNSPLSGSPGSSSHNLHDHIDSPDANRKSRSYTLIENALSDTYSRSFRTNSIQVDDQQQQQLSTTTTTPTNSSDS